MNAPANIVSDRTGFSLIEVIAIILILSVAYTMLTSYFGSFYTNSSLSVRRLARSLELKAAAERITEYYRQDTSADLNGLKNTLDTSPGDYGENFSVAYNGFVEFVSGNDAAITGSGAEDLLKVRIQHNDTRETITLLFSRQ